MKTALFDFVLPPERIATEPANPRDSSRMLEVCVNKLIDKKISEIIDCFSAGDLMVFNDTKVIPARLRGFKGGASIEIMLLRDKGLGQWSAFARPAKKLSIGDNIIFSKDLNAFVKDKNDTGEVLLTFNVNDVIERIRKIGTIPLPPYIKRVPTFLDIDSYQTVYAAKEGAVAAPTAGLHFSQNLLDVLRCKGIVQEFVTLHVGAGTFQPVKAEDTSAHIMHSEYVEISHNTAESINKAKKDGRRIIAVGTTSMRVLESAADTVNHVTAMRGDTAIFITPGYQFKIVDALLTNFHLPKSTLFMLVSAFAGRKRMLAAYKHAIEMEYRFYSYGDACLLNRFTQDLEDG